MKAALEDSRKEGDEEHRVENSNCESLMIIELPGTEHLQERTGSGKTVEQGKPIQGL